ncbi:hypothetical protein MMC14_004315 [Varicellaria rhodocarpa]|nr:hypothetical protein [Varicellaria rhodocarpa]
MSPPRQSLRQPSMNASQHSLALSAKNKRLSIIAEDGDIPSVPQPPNRVHHRPHNRRWNIGDPPRHSYENSPPAYSVWSLTKPKSEKLRDVRNNKIIVGRGGWRRILALALLVIATIIALVVGLVVGLRKGHNHQSETISPSPSNTTSTVNAPFPAGSYAITTFLDIVSTNCTSNPATWRCYPYTTYSSSHSGALATFNWVISPSNADGASNDTFTVSASHDPFAIDFSNAPLSLVDAGTSQERYTFSIQRQKTVFPTTAITTDNAAASCDYNNTQLQASLYTRMPNTYNASSQSSSTTQTLSTSNSSTGGFQAWPFAADVTQSIGGGANVPACYESNNGDRITNGLEPQPSTDMCTCEYKNFNP